MIENIKEWIIAKGIEGIAWCTDLDQTLIELGPNPEVLTMPSQVKENIYKINALTKNKFYIITGRSLEAVDKLFYPHILNVSAEYNNISRLDSDQKSRVQNFIPDWAALDGLLEELRHEIDDRIVIRTKLSMRSIHYKLVPLDLKVEVQGKLKNKLSVLVEKHNQKCAQKLVINFGDESFDIGPYPSCKSTVLNEIFDVLDIQENVGSLVPIFFGDSLGDLPLGLLVQQRGGKFIVIGSNEEVRKHGDYFLETPEDYHLLLQGLVEFYDSHY